MNKMMSKVDSNLQPWDSKQIFLQIFEFGGEEKVVLLKTLLHVDLRCHLSDNPILASLISS